MTPDASPRGAVRAPARNNLAPTLVVAALIALLAACAPLPPATDLAVATLPCRQSLPPNAAIAWWTPPSQSAREQREMARWCETVGPVVYRDAVANRSAPAPRNTLTVVSWNVHVGSGDVDALVRALRGGEFTAGQPVTDFVLLLQEAYRRDDAVPSRIRPHYPVPGRIAARKGRGPDVTHLSRDDGLALLYVPSMRNGLTDVAREDRGNAIASTLPLLDPAVVELPLEHQRRAVAVAVVEGRTPTGASWTLRVADVHLDTALALRRGGPFAARRRQAEALVAALRATAPKRDRVATIVAGDFNTVLGSHESAMRYLRRAFPATPDGPDTPTFSGPLGFRAALDHVFVDGVKSIEVRRLPTRFGSDHYPLLATVSF